MAFSVYEEESIVGSSRGIRDSLEDLVAVQLLALRKKYGKEENDILNDFTKIREVLRNRKNP